VRDVVRQMARQYSPALREYCAEGGEAALLRAYQLGRRAVGEGLGVLEVAALHEQHLVETLLERRALGDSARVAKRASEFFAECLAAFELTRRGFEEAHAMLRELNHGLTERLNSALRDFETAQDQLVEQRRIEQLKNEFISIMSHEVRTPLTSIHGALNLLKSGLGGDLDEQGRRLLDVAYRNSQRLVRLVNDLLDLQRIESGTMTLNMRPVTLPPLLKQALEVNQNYADQFGVRLVLGRVPAGARVRVDADRLMQVMTNLLSNAAKFSPAGESVVVEAGRRGRHLHVAVTDRGPGVPPEFRGRIFQKFAQAEPYSDRGGSGLGLSITRAIVEHLGGRIGFESEAGRTTFYFELAEWRPRPNAREQADEDAWAAGR
jgi:signal transduction histidine kinase